MSPQFVDFNGDGKIDIVAGTFDGSPHVALGGEKGFEQPVQILDKAGERIVFNQFWNFDKKKWDETKRCDLDGAVAGHLTSAVAFDWDGDGNYDLLLGDHTTGRIYLRKNEGTNAKPAFATKNVLVSAGDKPIDVPGTVSTLRVFDWNGDGRDDLIVSSMGDAYSGGGAGVYLFLNTGTKKEPVFAAPVALDRARYQQRPGPGRSPRRGLLRRRGRHRQRRRSRHRGRRILELDSGEARPHRRAEEARRRAPERCGGVLTPSRTSSMKPNKRP